MNTVFQYIHKINFSHLSYMKKSPKQTYLVGPHPRKSQILNIPLFSPHGECCKKKCPMPDSQFLGDLTSKKNGKKNHPKMIAIKTTAALQENDPSFSSINRKLKKVPESGNAKFQFFCISNWYCQTPTDPQNEMKLQRTMAELGAIFFPILPH